MRGKRKRRAQHSRLKGQRKLEAALKLGPPVTISWTRLERRRRRDERGVSSSSRRIRGREGKSRFSRYSLLNADDSLLSEGLLDDGVLGEGDSLLLDLTVTVGTKRERVSDEFQFDRARKERDDGKEERDEPSLVDESSDGRKVGLSVGDVGLDQSGEAKEEEEEDRSATKGGGVEGREKVERTGASAG